MPQDKSPLGDAMSHRFPEQKIPQPKPGATQPRRGGHRVADDATGSDARHPSQLPDEVPPRKQED